MKSNQNKMGVPSKIHSTAWSKKSFGFFTFLYEVKKW